MAFTQSAYVVHAAIEYFFLQGECLQAATQLFVFFQQADIHAFFGQQYSRQQPAKAASYYYYVILAGQKMVVLLVWHTVEVCHVYCAFNAY